MDYSKSLELIRQRRQTTPVELPVDASPRLEKFSNIKAVVFDVYGTLFSSGVGDISLASEANRDAILKATLEDNEIHVTSLAEKVRFDERLHASIKSHQDKRRLEGIEFPEVEIRKVWAEFVDQLEAFGFVETNQSIDFDLLVIDYESRINPTQPMPALESTLETLHRNGLILSIISNAQFYTPLLFETYLGKTIDDLNFCTHCAVWSYQLLEGKPSTQLYKISAKRFLEHHKINPDEVLYVGNDVRNDIWPAQLIGFKTALFAGDRLSLRRREDDPRCTKVRADIEVTNLSDLLTCLDL